MAFQAKIAEEKDMVILALEGKMDATSIEELHLGLEEVKRRGKKRIILLFKSLEHIDDQGEATLSAFLNWAENAESEVKIAEVQPKVMKALKLQGQKGVHDSLLDAMKSFLKNEETGMREEDGDAEGHVHSEGSKKPLFIIAGGLFLFFILIILYMTRDSSTGIEELQKRVALLEERMTRAGGQSKDLSVMQEKIEGVRKEFAERTKQVESDLAKLRQEMDSASTKPGPTTHSQVAQPPRVLKYHTVMQGETLFSISRKYGITLDELRRLNDLKSNQTLGVGQKLIVGSP
jgi:LysM repeat protein/anti-anti-sigma regulatory factor